MKTFTFFVIAFAVLAVTFAPDPPDSNEKPSDLNEDTETSAGTETGNEVKKTPVKSNPPTKSGKSAAAAKQKKAAEANRKKKLKEEEEEEDDKDVDIGLNFDDLEDEKDEISIPIPKLFSTKSDPSIIGKKIAELPPEEIKKYKKTLNMLMKNTETTFPLASNFYKAAIAAIQNPDAAKKWWNQQLKKEAENKGSILGANPIGLFNLGGIFGNDGPLGGINRVLNAGPIGVAGEAGAALLHGGISDFARSQSRNSDYFHDMWEHNQGIMKAVGTPLEMIPFFGDFKKGVDTAAEAIIPRSRYLKNRDWDDLSDAHAEAHDDARKIYKQRSNTLRRAIGLPSMENKGDEYLKE